MSDNPGAPRDRDTPLDSFVAELTRVAYRVALRHGTAGAWVDLELDLWRALADVVRGRERGSPPCSEEALACDRAACRSEAVTAGCVVGRISGTVAQPIDADLNPAPGEWALGQKAVDGGSRL
jgi:hypothetical protein